MAGAGLQGGGIPGAGVQGAGQPGGFSPGQSQVTPQDHEKVRDREGEAVGGEQPFLRALLRQPLVLPRGCSEPPSPRRQP